MEDAKVLGIGLAEEIRMDFKDILQSPLKGEASPQGT